MFVSERATCHAPLLMGRRSSGQLALVSVIDFKKPFSDGCTHRPVLFYGGYWVEEGMGSANDKFMSGST